MTIRRISITFVALLFATISFGQVKSIDERIAEAMNGSNWAELRSLYMSDGKNLQTPFLKPLSRFFISQFYNEPDSAIKYGKEILEKYQEELNSSVPSIMYFMAEDYATLGHYDKASALLHSLNEAYRKGGQTVNPVFEAYEDIYSKLSKCGTFSVERPNNNVCVPLLTHTGDRKNPEMMSVMANINGKEVKCNYDSGAGINIMTTKFAEHIKATVIQTKNIQMLGMSYVESKGLVVVDSLKLGDIVYRNVPFFVVDMRTDNPLANKKLEELGYECVIGNQTMMPLGEICFDFDRMQLVVPASYTPTPTYAPNFYRSPQRLFHLSLIEGCSGRKVDAIVDTGASGSILTNRYYKKNENRFTGRTATDSLRMAGVGGVNVVKTIPVSWTFTLAGEQYTETNIPVVTSSEQNEEYDCRIGLPTLMAHKKFIINFKNMWMRFED